MYNRLFKYAPDQPRDERGRWTDSAGGSAARAPASVSSPDVIHTGFDMNKPFKALADYNDKWMAERQNGIYDSVGDGTFWHGTSAQAWSTIQKEGLKPHGSPGADTWVSEHMGVHLDSLLDKKKARVYITGDKELAMRYAAFASKMTVSQPMLLHIQIPPDERAKMQNDPQDPRAFMLPQIKPEWITDHKLLAKIYQGSATLPTELWAVLLIAPPKDTSMTYSKMLKDLSGADLSAAGAVKQPSQQSPSYGHECPDGQCMVNGKCVPAPKGYKEMMQKRDFSQAQRDKLAEKGKAMPDGSFPIVSVQDLHNAVHALGRANNPEAVKRHIIDRARAMNALSALPPDWGVQKTEQQTPFSLRSRGLQQAFG